MKLLNNLEKKHYLLLAGWLAINLIQSFFTEMHADESYYWLYSKHLAWGFFDHPPMSAFLIFLGDSLFHNELGARLFSVLLTTFTAALIMNELNEKKDMVFLSIFMLSFPLFHTHIAGFLALPDAPLVCFTLLFFLTYRRFLEEPSWKFSTLLAILAAAMIYSKYHAFLVLGLVVLSNLKLLKSKYFWGILAGAIVLLLPHIIWQIDNHFPTFKYHLSDRSKPVQLKYFGDNIINQLLVAGPLTGVIIFYSLRKFKTNGNLFRRAIIFTIIGFYSVLLLLSFYNRIEAHWTSAITPLLMLAAYPIIVEHPKTKMWFKRLALPIVVVFFLFRFYLAANFIPNVGMLKLAFYNREATSEKIQDMANGYKVAFFSNWASPGMYQFYTGEKAILLATPGYRYSQFDLWNDEAYGEGDTLFVVIPDRMLNDHLIELPNGKKVTTAISPDFQSIKKLELRLDQIKETPTLFIASLNLKNHSDKTIFLNHPSEPSIGYAQNGKEIDRIPLYNFTEKAELQPGEEMNMEYKIAKETLETEQNFSIFTQTIERNRGQVLPIHIQ
jgi:hypothetical protein